MLALSEQALHLWHHHQPFRSAFHQPTKCFSWAKLTLLTTWVEETLKRKNSESIYVFTRQSEVITKRWINGRRGLAYVCYDMSPKSTRMKGKGKGTLPMFLKISTLKEGLSCWQTSYSEISSYVREMCQLLPLRVQLNPIWWDNSGFVFINSLWGLMTIHIFRIIMS